MINLKNIFVLMLIFIYSQAKSQSNNSELIFFPIDNLYKPNYSNPFEAKIGFDFYLNQNNIELNIGGDKDILNFKLDETNVVGLGTEFFTWTRLKSQSNFKFPVLTVDYFFGLYLSSRMNLLDYEILSRLRLSHISAHLADGHYDNENNQWIENVKPFVYSREFFELSSSLNLEFTKPYIGFGYIYHVKPEIYSKFFLSLGGELELFKLQNSSISGFISFDIKLMKRSENELQKDLSFNLGLKFKDQVRLCYQFYSGYDIHGELSSMYNKNSSIGIYLVL